jgi:hypothetical protein
MPKGRALISCNDRPSGFSTGIPDNLGLGARISGEMQAVCHP